MTISSFQCLVLTFLILQIQDIGCEHEDYRVHVSTDNTAQHGLCVHIPCRFTVPSDRPVTSSAKGFWYRPQSFVELVASNSDNPRRRMFFTGDVSKRDCSLFINDVQTGDRDYYQFRLQDYEDSHLYSYYNNRPYLRVTGLTDKPEISVGKMVAGKEATITCKSPGVCAGTAPVIKWDGRSGKIHDFNNKYQNFTSVYFSNITFTPSKKDHGLPLVCRVSFLGNTATTNQRINLNVEYPPDMTITVGATDYTFIFKEGEDKMMNCVVDSNPYSQITWFVGDEMKKGPSHGGSLVYRLNKLSLGDAGTYLCMGSNDHGTSNKTIEVIVHYPPRTPNIICQMAKDCAIDTFQRVIYVLENTTFSLLCTAESLPEASLSWVKFVWSATQIGVKGRLTFTNVSLRDEGQFKCIASNEWGQSGALVNIKVTYKPRTVTGRNSTCLEHEGLLECTCIIQSFPMANIEWNINEKIYPSSHQDKELSVTTKTLKAMTTSTLTCNPSQMNIRTIRCISSNEYGQLELLLFENNLQCEIGFSHLKYHTQPVYISGAVSDNNVIPAICFVFFPSQSGLKIEIIVAISCAVVVVLLLAGGFLALYYFRKKKLSNKPEDKKEIKAEDSSVIYSNSDVHRYGNQTTEVRTNSIYSVQEEDYEDFSYINIEDVQYASVKFSNIKPKIVPEDIEIEYAEIKK
ncbi:sialic acid-binding Ig-like lectin 16 [Leptodactylus fuscus]|uniref:sialic acid-binding Ig-like lectin 16 n=1 Tax=Leptodactylus fuscus TaxID=238119 RepID=UPI003F4F04AE